MSSAFFIYSGGAMSVLHIITVPGGRTRYLHGPHDVDLDMLYHEFRAHYRLGMTMQYIGDYTSQSGNWSLFRDMVRENATILLDSWHELYERGVVTTPNPENESMAALFVEYLVSHYGFRSSYPEPWVMEF